MSASVEVRDLSRRYGGHVQALQGIDLAVQPGEFVTLLGPSGSGKSTILKLVAGFDQPSAGDILIDGQSVVRLPSHRREIGMVFQNYALFPHMSVADNIAFPLQVRHCARRLLEERLAHALQITHLEAYRNRLPHELSGGQQQRVALARAIVFGPKILLMDEPLAALDRHLREQMKGEIKRIQQALQITVLFVTHDQDEALQMSDRIAVLSQGRLAQLATPRELYSQPADRFVAGFIGDANLLPCSISEGCVWMQDIPLQPAPPQTQAGPAWLMIRPEKLQASYAGQAESVDSAAPGLHQVADGSSPASDAAMVRLSGQVLTATFLGEASRYEIDVRGHRMVIRQPNSGPGFTPGDQLTLAWRAADAVVLQR